MINDMKKNNKVLYENIMTSIAKEVKKALNEEKLTTRSDGMNSGKKSKVFEDYDNIDDVNIQSETERWCDAIETYLWDHITGIQSNASETLGLFATLVYLDQLDDEEIKEIAERIMEQIDEDEEYDNPPVDEAFHVAVIEKLKEDASDWCADVINEWKLNQ